MLVTLHDFIQLGMVWRYEAVNVFDDWASARHVEIEKSNQYRLIDERNFELSSLLVGSGIRENESWFLMTFSD